MPLAEPLEALFNDAVPRLTRRARAQHIAPDVADDIVQETLIEAWRSLDHLRDQERFAAWLDGIYRNVCLRHQRKQGILRSRELLLDGTDDGSGDSGDGAADPLAHLADPRTFDPTEELARQDMTSLLDRTLGYLAPTSRALVQRHYLAEVSQRELAAQMGLSLSALESRLHRARGEMLRVLSGDLRAEALALGLALNPADATEWRETRIWCVICGRRRMEGIFEPMPDGRINMRLRCSGCESRAMEMNSLGIVDLTNARSFLPATRKMIDGASHYYVVALAAGGVGRCWVCHQPNRVHALRDNAIDAFQGMQTWVETTCACPPMRIQAIWLYAALPQVRAFLYGGDRILIGPEAEVNYSGQEAIRFSLLSLTEGRRLDIFAEAATLLPLAVVLE